ncbi:atrophin-1-like isoform X2 [Physella acuta]|nr:atrophin-1-like isoform X2 [Physella acuta]
MYDSHGIMFGHEDPEDRSSLEAAAEAAAKVNAMLIAKGMLKPNQIHAATNVITKKAGGPNSLVVAEVEINNLTTPCRNTLTRGTTQEEISKASGAAVTTRGRFMAPDEKARSPSDRCLYLNVQAASKESVDIAVQKINEIIRSMCGSKSEAKVRGANHNRGGRMRQPFRPNANNNRFSFRGQPPPPLMSLPTPPPPQVQLVPHSHPPPQQITVLQENLYIGLEHAPPNFDTKNKLLGPGGSYLMHIQSETGAAVSLRGKGSGFGGMNGMDSIEPMHVHLEHHSYVALQEAKKLAENLIQTVQQSYVSFQQALAALPASVPTGLITGVPQQPPTFVEAQIGHPGPGLATITMTEQTIQALQPQVQQLGPPTMLMPPGSVASQLSQMPQGLTNTAQTLMIPSSLSLTSMPILNTMQASAASMLPQQPTHLDLGAQQQMILSQPPPGTPQALAQVGLQQIVPAPSPAPQALPSHYGVYSHVQPPMHLVSQPVSIASHAIVQQAGPPMLTQPTQHILAQQTPINVPPGHSISMSAPTSLVYTMASSGPTYYTTPRLEEEEPKRRFTEEKDDKIPENLLGYQHGPPHLVNLVRSSPPPHSLHSQMSQGAQLIQTSHHGLIQLSHIPPDQNQFAHLGQTIIQSSPQLFQPPPEGQQILAHPYHTGLPPPHFMTGPPPPSLSPTQQLPRSPSLENRPPSQGSSQCSTALMPPPPPPAVTSQAGEGTMPPPKSADVPWGSGSKRRVSPSPSETSKKKIRGILKNKHNSAQQELEKEGTEPSEGKLESQEELEDKRHPASPQYQGQPLRYPSMPSDPNLPPTSQESGVSLQHRSIGPQIPNGLPPGHHLLQQSDPNFPPQVNIAHQHLHIEGPRPEGPPNQIVIEHPGVPGTPVHITHHRLTAPGQIHIEHALTGPPPRQVLIEHPAQQTMHLEHPNGAITGPPPGHPEHVHTHVPVSHPGQTQEIYEFDIGAQQLQQPPPHFHQAFEHITVSQASQPGEHLLPPGSAVIVSNTQHFPQYSVAISTAAPPPPVSYSLPTTTQFTMQNQAMAQHIQRLPEPQHISVPPPPPPSYTIGLPPSPSPHYQTHFAGMQPAHPQSIPAHLFHQTQQPPPPQASQYQHPQGISYWVSPT